MFLRATRLFDIETLTLMNYPDGEVRCIDLPEVSLQRPKVIFR
jgi:hypothetical protein